MKRSPAGFTLVELVLVLAVLSIMMSIAIPSMSTAKDRARYGALAAELNTLEHGLYDYDLARGALPPTNHLEYLVLDGILPAIANDPYTPHLPREAGPLAAWDVQERADYRYVNDTVARTAWLWPESHPEMIIQISYGSD